MESTLAENITTSNPEASPLGKAVCQVLGLVDEKSIESPDQVEVITYLPKLNANWIIRHHGPKQSTNFFLKLFRGPFANLNYLNTRRFYSDNPHLADSVPRLIDVHDSTMAMLFEYVGAGAASPSSHADGVGCGQVLGRLHSTPLGEPVERSGSTISGQSGIPFEMWEHLTVAQLGWVRQYQRDTDLIDAIAAFRTESAEETPVHGDIKQDQFLKSGAHIVLSDWDEYSIGDPAADVGAFLGSQLAESLQSFAVECKTKNKIATTFRLDSSWEPWATRAPLVNGFLEGYSRHSELPSVSSLIHWMGIHLLNNTLSTIGAVGRRAQSVQLKEQIARGLILQPTRMTPLLTGLSYEGRTVE